MKGLVQRSSLGVLVFSLLLMISCGGGSTTTNSPLPPGPPGPPPPGSEQVVVVGVSGSPDFPVTQGALRTTFNGGTSADGFISSIRLQSGSSGTTAQVTFSTFFAGTSPLEVRDVFLDTQGNIYVTGRTGATNLPTTPGAFQPSFRGGPQDAVVAKLTADGRLVFATYLGGSAYDVGYGIYGDTAGFIYVCGRTSSTDFPTTPGAFDRTYNGGQSSVSPYFGGDFFVVKMLPDGSGLVWGTYVGGSDDDTGRGRVTVDSAGNVYAQGSTGSSNFPRTAGAFQGNHAAAIVKLSPNGQLLFSTVVSGSAGTGLASASGGLFVTSTGEAIVGGFTSAPDFPNTTARTFGGGSADVFVMRLSSTGQVLASTLLGGSGFDSGAALAVDSSGNVTVMGETFSPDFPLQSALQGQASLRGSNDVFVTKLSPDFSTLLFSTYLGGNGSEAADGVRIEIDSAGDFFLFANSDSADFPVTGNRLQNFAGSQDTAIVRLSSDGQRILYGTFLGGGGSEIARSLRYHRN